MIKLREIINQLDEQNYNEIENELLKSKAKNFHFLLTALRQNNKPEKEICRELQISNSAFYALKSRLMDKIQDHLSGISDFQKEELMELMSRIPELCNHTPRETANAILQKLETDLISQGMHNELLVVYSSLKKINLHSPKYFTYSQLFNKSVAFSLSLEKAAEISCEFSRILSTYLVSGDDNLMDSLSFLYNEIGNVFELNGSRQIALVKNFILLQYDFIKRKRDHLTPVTDPEQILRDTYSLIQSIPDKAEADMYTLITDYLSFEYHYAYRNYKKAEEFYVKIIPHFNTLLLISYKSCTMTFLKSSMAFCLHNDRKKDIAVLGNEVLVDPDDVHTRLMMDYYNAMAYYLEGQTKKAITLLNNIINTYSLPNMFHMEVEVKLLLSYFLFKQKEYDMADGVLKKLMRKIKTDYKGQYIQVDYFARMMALDINKESTEKTAQRKREYRALFFSYNNDNHAVLEVLVPELLAMDSSK